MKSHLSWVDTGVDIVIIDARNSRVLSLSEVGTALFRHIQKNGTHFESLVQHVLGEFEVDRAAAEQDVHTFLHELQTLGLLDDE